jgi:hypothetical protein
MSTLHLSVKTNKNTFVPDETFLPKIYLPYSDDQKEKYMIDIAYCQRMGWVDECVAPPGLEGDDILDNENNVIAWSYGLTGTKIVISVDGSETTAIFSGNNLQEFIDYFIIFRENFKPLADHYRNHPGEGTTSVWVENSPGDSTTYVLPQYMFI